MFKTVTWKTSVKTGDNASEIRTGLLPTGSPQSPVQSYSQGHYRKHKPLHQGCTNPGRHVDVATKFHVASPNICAFSAQN